MTEQLEEQLEAQSQTGKQKTATRLVLSRADFFPKLWAQDTLSLEPLGPGSFRFASFLWSNIGIGAPEDRSGFEAGDWAARLSNPACQFFAVYSLAEPVGCVEIERQRRLMLEGDDRVKITAFGLLPEFVGEGFGPSLLTRVVEKAFAMGADRVYLELEPGLSPAMDAACFSQGFRPI